MSPCPRRRASRAAAGIIMAAILVVGPGAELPAGAESDEPLEISIEDGSTVFDTEELYPGATESASVAARSRAVESGVLRVSALDVTGEDRCSPAEVRAGMSCGDGRPSNLIEQLVFTVEEIATGGLEPIWSGQLRDLSNVDLGHLAGGGERRFRFSVMLPVTSGNETQNDTLGFEIRFDLSSLAGADVLSDGVVVGGADLGGGAPAPRLFGIPLPRTGLDARSLVWIAALVTLVGLSTLALSTFADRRPRDHVA